MVIFWAPAMWRVLAFYINIIYNYYKEGDLVEKGDKKEILTRELIKKELTEVFTYNLLFRILFLALVSFVTFCIVSLAGYHLLQKENYAPVGVTILSAFYVALAIFIAIMFVFAIYSLYKFIAMIIAANKNKYDIVIDKLVNSELDGSHKYNPFEYSFSEEMELHTARKPFMYLFPRLARDHLKGTYIMRKLSFAKHKDFYLPEGKLYRWSDKYRMEDWAVYRWAEVGDEFYLIIIDKKVRYVYNAKHFELKE